MNGMKTTIAGRRGSGPIFASGKMGLSPLRRTGFTLVELLVVVAIIGVLAGLISVAAIRVRTMALTARMKIEVMAMDQALNAFKEKFGEYPPDGSNPLAVQSFLATAFPRYIYSGGTWQPPTNQITGNTPPALNPSTALVFWLGGMQDANGNFVGFSANQTNPFDANPSRIGPFFDFQTARIPPLNLRATPQYSPFISSYQYFPDNGLSPPACTDCAIVYSANNTSHGLSTVPAAGTGSPVPVCSPYLYFASQNGTYYFVPSDSKNIFTLPGGTGVVTAVCECVTGQSGVALTSIPQTGTWTSSPRPYIDVRLSYSSGGNPSPAYVNTKTFQILCPGLDGVYGSGNSYPTGVAANPTIGAILTPAASAYDTAPAYQDDDVTNFLQKGKVADDVPH